MIQEWLERNGLRTFAALASATVTAQPMPSMITEIARRYELGDVQHWDDLDGSQTRNLKLQVDDHLWVARVHPLSTSADRLAAVQAARWASRSAGLKTPTPISAGDGSTMVVLTDGGLAEVEPFVAWSQRMNTQAQMRRGFALLGGLHDALRTTPLPAAAAEAPHANHLHAAEAATRTRVGADRIRGWRDRDLSRFADRVEEHIDTVAAAEEPLDAGQIWQIVHGDFWDNNVLFRQGELVAVIDFDFMGRRARIDDLALAIYFWLLKPGRGLPDVHDRRFVAELADAYDTGTTEPLSANERLALPLAIARQPAWSVGRWVPYLDEENSRRHAREAMSEFAVAAKVLSEIESWQTELSRSFR